MRGYNRGDIWDEVWAEYDARQAARAEAEVAARAMATGGHSQASFRPLSHVLPAVLAGILLVAAWMALPWLLGARLAAPIAARDAAALLQHFDRPAAMASLRAGLAAEVPQSEGEGARRFFDRMAGRMAAAWEEPERVAAWLSLRAAGGEGTAAALSSLRSARPLGLTSFRVEYGPAGEASGVAFDIAWRGDGFRVTGLRFLDTPSAPVGAAGPALAMR